MKKICLFIIVLNLIHTALFAQDSVKQLTLQQCIDIAIRNNADVQHRQITSEQSAAYVTQARAGLLPTLSGDVSHGVNQGRSIDPFTNQYINQSYRYANYGANANLTLFNGFAVQNNIKQARLTLDATNLETQSQKDLVALNVILSYIQVLTNQDLATQSQNQVNLSEKQVARLQVLNDTGAVAPNEYYDIKGQYANEKVALVNAMNEIEAARLALAQYLNVPYNKQLVLAPLTLANTDSDTTSTSDSVYNAAVKNLAVIKAADYRRNSAKYNLRSYKGLYYPSLFLSGGIYSNYSSAASIQRLINSEEVATENYVLSGSSKLPVYVKQDNFASDKIKYGDQLSNNFNSSVSIGIRIPLFNGAQTRTQVKIAALQLKDAEVTYNATKVALQQNSERALVNKKLAYNKLLAAQEESGSFKESFRVVEVKFEAGVSTSVDYLVAKNYYDQANTDVIVAKYQYILYSMVLDYYKGNIRFDGNATVQ